MICTTVDMICDATAELFYLHFVNEKHSDTSGMKTVYITIFRSPWCMSAWWSSPASDISSNLFNITPASPFLVTFLLGMLCIVKYSSVVSLPVRHFPLADECSSIPFLLSASAFEFEALFGDISSLSELTLVMLVFMDVFVVRLLPVPLLSVLEFLTP